MSLVQYIALLLLAAALFAAEHTSPLVGFAAGEWTADQLLLAREGGWARRVGYLAIGALGAIWLLTAPRRRQLQSGTALLLVGLLCWAAISMGWSVEPFAGARRLIVILILAGAALGAAKQWSTETLAAFIALSGASIVAWGVGLEAFHGQLLAGDDYRFQGTLHPNEQGALCAVVALAGLVSAMTFSRFRTVFGLVFLFAVGCLLMTKSRTASAGFVAGLAVCVWPVLSSAARWTYGYVGAVVSLFVAFLAGPGLLRTAGAAISLGRDGAETLTGRIPLWDELLEYYVGLQPLHGYGYETFWTTDRIHVVSESQNWGVAAAHSAPMELLLTLGLVGVLLHTLLLTGGSWASLSRFASDRRPATLLAASLCVFYLVVGLMESVLVIKASAITFYFYCMLFAVGMRSRSGSHSDAVAGGEA